MSMPTTDFPTCIKKTKQREYVISVLNSVNEPITANVIFAKIFEMDYKISLSTIYRILDVLTENKIVSKSYLINRDAAYELSSNIHKHHAICVNCNKIVSMNNCPLDSFVPNISDSNFQITGHQIELYGYCGKCQEKK